MTSSRVKILCVRARPNAASAEIHNAVIDEWIAALALHADVETIDRDFDLVEVYERVKPDFLLFDSINWGRRHRLNIANIDAYPDLPRALLANNDPHDPMRPLMFDMLPACGIDTIFCTGHEDLQQMSELRRFNCFVLPKFVDPAVFRDYGEAKSIPIAIMSAHLMPAFYPWRAQVTQEIQHILPTLLYTHPGYVTGTNNPFSIQGESYARMLSRSQFCVADTTVLDYVVRKHLEIPAAGSVLVSPECKALADYGFVDMENCLLGPAGAELYKKIIAVARDQQLYEQIRANGHALVHARYTREAWTHILDWYACRRVLKLGEKVQQDGVFGKFKAVPDTVQVQSIADFTVLDNPMATRLRAAREALLNGGDLAAAVEGLREAMTWVGHVGEPWFMMGVISFALGDLDNARSWLLQRCDAQGQEDAGLALLDPCEIAWLMLIAYVAADDELFQRMLQAAAATSHLSIRRVQWLIDGGAPVVDLAEAGLDKPRAEDRLSIHWLGDEDFDAWFGLIHKGLSAHAAVAQAA